MAGITMFIFKKESRNAMNNEREDDEFRNNYKKIFKVNLPHMDTVNKVMLIIDNEELEILKIGLVKALIRKKILDKDLLFSGYYKIIVDGTCEMIVKESHCNSCLHRITKNGQIIYFHNVLEAKLVDGRGFCISLLTEWIENKDKEYNKQDCELKAFKRLSDRLKKHYHRMRMCIICDGLYANQTFFNICKEKDWKFIITFRDGNLPSVWDEVNGLKELQQENSYNDKLYIKGHDVYRNYKWINAINYNGFEIDWCECLEKIENKESRFTYISNFNIDIKNILRLVNAGRMRWKIENEGFNTQKNLGYGLEHKYSRVSMQATKNYYQCMQIAHLINQLFELGSLLKSMVSIKTSIKHIWEIILGELRKTLNMEELALLLKCKMQIRFG